MDPDISLECRPDCFDIQSLLYIRVYSLVEHRCMLEGKNKMEHHLHFYIAHLVHKVTDSTDLWFLLVDSLVVELQNRIFRFSTD